MLSRQPPLSLACFGKNAESQHMPSILNVRPQMTDRAFDLTVRLIGAIVETRPCDNVS